MRRTAWLLAVGLLLAGCGTTPAAAPVTSTATSTITKSVPTTVSVSVTVTVTATATATPSSTVAAADSADVTACRTFYNALSAAGISDLLEGKIKPVKDLDGLDFYIALKSYQRAGAVDAGASSGSVAEAITATNGYILDMLGRDPVQWSKEDVSYLSKGYKITGETCGAIGAWA